VTLHRGHFVIALAAAALVALVMFQQRTRTIEGTWIDLFEGSSFFEGQGLGQACTPRFWDAPWFGYYPKEETPEGKLIEADRGSGVFISEYGTSSVAAYSVKFVGHQNILDVGFGHLGARPSEFKVERMISMEPIENVRCDIRS
jgi:hypothetical protein